MTESTNNDQQTNQANPVIPTVSELPSYNDLGTRTQFESLVNLNSPPPQQPLFTQSVPAYGSPYGNPYGHLGYPGRPVYYKPATNQPVTFQYQPQPQQYQPQPPQYGAVVQNYSFPQNAARDIFFKNAFPTGYVVFHNVFAILLSLALVTLQVLLLTNSANGSYVGGGFWSGAWMIFTAIFSLSTLGCKNGCTIVSSVVFQLLGVFFTFGGSVVMSLVAASENMPCWSYYDYCDKVVVWQLLYTQAAVGACLMLLSLIFSIFVLVRFARARRQLNEFYNSQYSHMYHQQTLATTNPNYHQNWNNSRAPRLV